LPIYEYECQSCDNIDELIEINYNSSKTKKCSECGGKSKRIISIGAVHTDTPTWINDDLRGSIQGDDEKPIRSRKDLAEVVAKKKIEPIEKGHRNLRMI